MFRRYLRQLVAIAIVAVATGFSQLRVAPQRRLASTHAATSGESQGRSDSQGRRSALAQGVSRAFLAGLAFTAPAYAAGDEAPYR